MRIKGLTSGMETKRLLECGDGGVGDGGGTGAEGLVGRDVEVADQLDVDSLEIGVEERSK